MVREEGALSGGRVNELEAAVACNRKCLCVSTSAVYGGAVLSVSCVSDSTKGEKGIVT